MNTSIETLLSDILSVKRCQKDVKEIAQRLKAVPPKDIEQLIEIMIERFESEALGIVYLGIFINRTAVDTKLLLAGTQIIDNLFDAFAPYRYCSPKAIPGLVEMARSGKFAWERKAYAAFLAVYLLRKYKHDTREIKIIIKKLTLEIITPEASTIITAAMLGLDDLADFSEPPLSTYLPDFMQIVPETPPGRVIASGYTIKRISAKVSRNAPCPCGSGKKFKKCCMGKKDELKTNELRRDMVVADQEYQPVQLSAQDYIYNLRPFELTRLKAEDLDKDQLFWAFDRLRLYEHFEKALQMLIEYESKFEDDDFDSGHYYDLIRATLKKGNIKVAEKIIPRLVDMGSQQLEFISYQLELLKTRQLDKLEDICSKCVKGEYDIIDFCYTLYEVNYPAIFILFVRSVVAETPQRDVDIEFLFEMVTKARFELELEEFGEMSLDNWYTLREEMEQDEVAEQQFVENIELKDELKTAQRKSGKIALELARKEKELEKLEERKKELEKSVLKSKREQTPKPDSPSADERIENLRRKTKNLQVELNRQQQTRLELRSQIQSSRTMISNLLKEKQQTKPVDATVPEIKIPAKLPEKIIVPEYFSGFRKQAEHLPAEIVAKALTAINSIVLNEAEVWKHISSIETYDELFRIRAGISYRVMFRWKPGKYLHVLDIIPRSKLETWLKQYNH